MASPDIRAGMAMLIAALCAEGTSTIGNVGQIDRGYERIDERLRALGASHRGAPPAYPASASACRRHGGCHARRPLAQPRIVATDAARAR